MGREIRKKFHQNTSGMLKMELKTLSFGRMRTISSPEIRLYWRNILWENTHPSAVSIQAWLYGARLSMSSAMRRDMVCQKVSV